MNAGTGRAQSELEGLPQECQRPLRLGVMLSTKGDHRTVGMREIQRLLGIASLPLIGNSQPVTAEKLALG